MRNYNQDYFKVQGHEVKDRALTRESRHHYTAERADLRRHAPIPARQPHEPQPVETGPHETTHDPGRGSRAEQTTRKMERELKAARRRTGTRAARTSGAVKETMREGVEDAREWIAGRSERLSGRARDMRTKLVRGARFGIGVVLTPVVLARLVWRLRKA